MKTTPLMLVLLTCDAGEPPDREHVEKAVERAGEGLRDGYAKAKAKVEEVDWERVYEQTAEQVDKAREGLESKTNAPPPEPEPKNWWDRANEAVTCGGDICEIAGWWSRAAKRHPERLRLDVRVFTAPEGDGWRVDRIRPGSMAAVLGFEDGDVVQSVAGQPLTDPWARVKALQALQSSRSLPVVYRRGDATHTLTLVFAER
jgi:type II secretory pathway component PulC